MIAGLRHRMPVAGERFLNHLIVWLAILLVASIAGFAAYYYYDRQAGNTGPSPLELATTRAEEAVRANPEDLGARMALAGVYFTAERYTDSVEQYRAALTLDEKNLGPISGLARALYEAGNAEEAVTYFQKIVDASQEADLSPQLVGTAHFFLAKIALDQKNGDEAIAQAKAALAADRSDADALQVLGAAYVAAGNWDDAITALSRSVAFVPDFREAYEQLAIAYEGKGMAAQAHYAKGMQSYSMGRYDSAAKELGAATAAAPDFAAAHLGLGLTLAKQGKKDAAIAEYEKTMQLDPNNFTAQTSLAQMGKPWGGADGSGSSAHGSLGIPDTSSTPAQEVKP